MNNISFDNPWLLLLLIPMLAAVFVPFFITVRRDNANCHNITAVCLHTVLCICLALTIAGMTFESVITETNVYVLADVSYSANHNLDEVQEKVEDIAGKLPKNSKMGVIAFGRNQEILSDIGDRIPNVKNAGNVDKSATDLASALRYAGNLFDDGVIKRIIIITDGAETVAASNIIKVVNNLQETDVCVDAVYLDDTLEKDVRELQIDAVEANYSTYLNKNEKVNVMVRANCGVKEDGTVNDRIDGYIGLYRDGTLLERRASSFYNGLNVFSLPVPTEETGEFAYEVKVEAVNAGDDASPHNNSYLFNQKITAEFNVLFIGGSQADVAAGMHIYGDKNVKYVTEISDIPLSVEEMCVYDEIAMSNFDVRRIPASTMFLNSLTVIVNDYGKTLTTYGNTFLQENTSGDNQALNMLADLLPVRVGNYDMDERLITIILDISLSMNFSGRFAVAKRAAIELLSVLNPNDMVMVISFSGGVKELLPPTRLTNTSVIINKINQAEAENGTNISSAFKHAYDLMPKNFHEKQVILISDGMNPADDYGESVSLADQMSRDGILISTLGIFATADGRKLLTDIYGTNTLPGAFNKNIEHEQDIDFTIKDISGEKQQVRIEGDRYSVDFDRTDDVAEGIENIGEISGFWYNAAKSTATTAVTAKYFRDKTTSFDVPVYAYWSGGGKGKVVSFMSDISNEWTDGWSEGTGGNKLLSNIPLATLPNERNVMPFIVDVGVESGTATVNVKGSSNLGSSTEFTVTLTDPVNKVTVKTLAYNAGSYFANFGVDAPGVYKVHLEYTLKDVHYEADTEFTVSYYAEYDAFASYSKSYLYRLLTENGSILELDEVTVLENNGVNYTTYIFNFTVPLMIVSAVLFVVSIIIRQLKWKDVTSFFKGFTRRKH